jgi:hypothetical protein
LETSVLPDSFIAGFPLQQQHQRLRVSARRDGRDTAQLAIDTIADAFADAAVWSVHGSPATGAWSITAVEGGGARTGSTPAICMPITLWHRLDALTTVIITGREAKK